MAIEDQILDFIGQNPDAASQVWRQATQAGMLNPGQLFGLGQFFDPSKHFNRGQVTNPANWYQGTSNNPYDFGRATNIFNWDLAGGAPQNIPGDIQRQLGFPRFRAPGPNPKIPQVGQGNASQALGLTGAASGLPGPSPAAQPPQVGQGNQPIQPR